MVAQDLVVVGAAARDVDASDPRGWRLGGTVAYAALAAARLGMHVKALVGVDSEGAAAPEFDVLRGAGIDMRFVPLRSGPVFHNRQTPAGRVQHALAASDPVPLEALPADWRAPGAALLGPLAGELGPEWAHAFNESVYVTLAAQGLLRRLEPGRLVERLPISASPLFNRADAILVSVEDIVDRAPLVRGLLRMGQRLVVTHGERGALLLERCAGAGLTGRMLPAVPRRAARDTTGAGDVFLAAWTAAHVILGSVAEPWRALLVASVMAGLSVERTQLADVPTLRDVCEELVRLRDGHLG